MSDNDGVVHSSGEPLKQKGFRAWIKGKRGKDLYETADPPAQWIKALAQMAIGVGTVIAFGGTNLVPSPQKWRDCAVCSSHHGHRIGSSRSRRIDLHAFY